MPEIRVWVDKKVYDGFKKACTEAGILNEPDCLQLALLFFSAAVKLCRDKGKAPEQCFDVVMQVVEEKLR